MGKSHTFFAAISLACTATLALTACTDSGSDTTPGPSLPLPGLKLGFQEVAVPEALAGSTPLVKAQIALAPKDAKSEPTLVTRSTQPDGSSSIQLWQSGTATKPMATLNQPTATSIAAGASPSLAVIAGNRLKDRHRTLWAQVSPDRSSWHDLALDDTAQGLDLDAATVVGDRTVIAASDDARADWLAVGDQTKSGRFVKLPSAANSQEATSSSLSGHGSQLLVVRDIGPRGGVTVPHALVSPDLGKTWAEHPITGLDSVAGIVWTGQAYVATGWSRTSGDDKFVATAAHSVDGVTWTAETIPAPGAEQEVSRTQSYLWIPTVSAGAVQAQFGCTCVASQVMERSPAGTWRSLGETTRSHEPSAPGLAWRSATGPHLSLIDRSSLKHYARSSVSKQLSSTTLVPAAEPATVNNVVPLDGTDLVTATRQVVNIPSDRNWSTTSMPVNFAHTAKGGIVDTPEAVAAFKNLDDVASAIGPGKQVTMIGTVFQQDEDGGAWRATSLTQQGGRGAWTTGKGLNVDEFTLAKDVVYAGSTWYAAITAAPDASFSRDRRARILRSSDGTNWKDMEGDWAKENSGSAVNDLCVTASGKPLAVGSITSPDRTLKHGAAWTLEAGRWVVTAHAAKGGARSEFGKCATTASGIVISGSSGDRSATWTTKDGKTLQEPSLAPDNEARGAAETVGGVVLAPGVLSHHDNEGPVLWVSDTGSRWRSIPLPADSAAKSVAVHRAQGGVLVVASTGNGTKAWRVTGLPTPTSTPSPSVSSSS